MKTICIWGLLLVLFSGCSKKLTEHAVVDQPVKIKDKDLILVLDSLSKLTYETLYTKLDVSYSDGKQNLSFKTSVKHIHDSVVNAIVSYLRFPVLSCLLDKDSIRIVNRNDKCYSVSDLNYFKQQFGVDVEFQNLEEIISAKPLDFDLEQKYFVVQNHKEYAVSTHRKRELKRLERKAKEDMVITYYLDESLTLLKKEIINSLSDSVNVEVHYLKYQNIEGKFIPENVLIEIKTPKKSLKINIEYNKVEIDQEQEILFIIPESYEECD